MNETQKEFKPQSPDMDIVVKDKRHTAQTPVVQTELPSVQDDSPNAMIMMALQNKYDPAVIKELMDLRDREVAHRDREEEKLAEKAHTKAFANFKKRRFDLIKDKINESAKNAPYISAGQLLGIVNPELSEEGLVANFRIEDSEDYQHVRVVCVLTHHSGHSIESGMTAKVETTGPKGAAVMTEMHARLSLLTYLMKATFSAVVGVAAIEDKFDDDGNRAGGSVDEFITDEQAKSIENRVKAIFPDDPSLFMTWLQNGTGAETIDTIPAQHLKSIQRTLSEQEAAAKREPGQEG